MGSYGWVGARILAPHSVYEARYRALGWGDLEALWDGMVVPGEGGLVPMLRGAISLHRQYSSTVTLVAPAAGGGGSSPGAAWPVAARCGLYSCCSH